MIREKLIFKVPIEVAPPVPVFHPSDLSGGQLYLRRDQATVSSWISDIGTARDFVQATATKQPTLGVNKVVFDGTDDFMEVSETNPFGADNEGVIFFSGYFDNAATNSILTSCRSNLNTEDFATQITSSGLLRIVVVIAGVVTIISATNLIANGAYFYGYIQANNLGNPYIISLDGSIETNIVVSGTDNSPWFSSSPDRNNLALGGRIRLSPIYRLQEINKIYYNNTVLTSGEIADMNTFMSDPTNY